MSEITEDARHWLSRWAVWVKRGAISTTLILIVLWATYAFPVGMITLDISVQRLSSKEAGLFFFFALMGLIALGCATTAVVRLWQASAALQSAYNSTEQLEKGVQHLSDFWKWVLFTMSVGVFTILMLIAMNI